MAEPWHSIRACEPADIALDRNGNVWAVDSAFDVVEEYDSAGEVIKEVGYEGTRNGEFIDPTSIAFTQSGNFWVGDETNRLQEFDADGNFIKAIGTKGLRIWWGSGSGLSGVSARRGWPEDIKMNLVEYDDIPESRLTA